MSKTNYEDYGYEPGTKISITEDLYGKICELVQYLGQRERYIVFEEYEDLDKTLSPENKAKQAMTPQGLLALTVALRLNQVHVENVESGLAKHKDELEKPQLGTPNVVLAKA